jgi:hypothetical protein
MFLFLTLILIVICISIIKFDTEIEIIGIRPVIKRRDLVIKANGNYYRPRTMSDVMREELQLSSNKVKPTLISKPKTYFIGE